VYAFLVVEIHCVFSAHILKLCVFSPDMCVKNAKRRPKIITVHGVQNRFSKCNFQKSSYPKLQGSELSYVVYNIRGPLPKLLKYATGVKIDQAPVSQFYIELQ